METTGLLGVEGLLAFGVYAAVNTCSMLLTSPKHVKYRQGHSNKSGAESWDERGREKPGRVY